MSASFTNQVLAQIELHQNAEKIGKNVLMLPKQTLVDQLLSAAPFI